MVIDGQARGIITRDLATGELTRHVAHAVVLATGWLPADVSEYEHLGCGTLENVVTNAQFERMANEGKVPAKVAFIQKRVEEAVPDIKEALPSYSAERGLLSLCFIDPFSADLDFSVIRELGQSFKMDFLVLLMSGVDIRQNFQRYLEDESDTRIADLIEDPNWREDWAQRGMRKRDLVHFVLEKFDAAMTRLGYEAQGPEESHPVRAHGKGVLLYHLVFYSRHQLAKRLFRAAEARIDPQTRLGL